MRKFINAALVILLILFCYAGCSRDSNKTADQLNDEAMALLNQQQISKALEKAESALEKAEKTFGENDPKTAKYLQTVAMVRQAEGSFAKAESAYKKAYAIVSDESGGDSLEAAKIMNNLAGCYYTQKRYDLAADTYQQVLKVAEKKFPDDDPRLNAIRANLHASIAGKEGKEGEEGKAPELPLESAPEVNPPQIADLVPPKVKQYALDSLSKQNIKISDLQPEAALQIMDKGIVFPYRGIRRLENGNEQKVVVLFASIKNPEKQDTYVFQNCRVISYQSYQSKLDEGGIDLLKKEVAKLFPGLYPEGGTG